MEKPQSYGRLINVIQRKSFAEEARAADRWILNERSIDNEHEGPATLGEISDVSFGLILERATLPTSDNGFHSRHCCSAINARAIPEKFVE
jgi:hypothetical protein